MIWGIGLLADAGLRVVTAYSVPIDVVPGAGGALYPVTFLVLPVLDQINYYRSGLWQILLAWGDPHEQPSRDPPPRQRLRRPYPWRAVRTAGGPLSNLSSTPHTINLELIGSRTIGERPWPHLIASLRGSRRPSPTTTSRPSLICCMPTT